MQTAFDAAHGAASQTGGAKRGTAFFRFVSETVLSDFGGVVCGHVSRRFPCARLPVHPTEVHGNEVDWVCRSYFNRLSGTEPDVYFVFALAAWLAAFKAADVAFGHVFPRAFMACVWPLLASSSQRASAASHQLLGDTKRSFKVHGVFCQASISWRIKWCDCGKRSVQFSGQENSNSFSLGSQRN